jgi:site-specific DNA recombinase
MWMGGVPPLGYRAQDRKLVIVESEAEIVRLIFRRYEELGSVRLLKDELEARSIQSKLRTSASGRISGGKPFARGALYLMLQNRIYRGEIVHNEQSHLGEHEPIIDQPLWDAVQAHLPVTQQTATRANEITNRACSPACWLMATAIG